MRDFASQRHAKIELLRATKIELLGAVSSMRSVPRLYLENLMFECWNIKLMKLRLRRFTFLEVVDRLSPSLH
jgi:hypothetical protein